MTTQGDTRRPELPGDLRVRQASLADLTRLFELSRMCFPSESWTLEGVREELTREAASCWIVEAEAQSLIAFLIAWRVVDEVHLLQIATHEEWRRRGLAEFLLEQVLAEVRADGARLMYLEVRASNTAARALYEKHGFTILGVRKAYYRQPAEDAVVMVKTLDSSG